MLDDRRADCANFLPGEKLIFTARGADRAGIYLGQDEALERRKAAGLPVGRPKGRATKLMLDDRRAVDYLNKGVSKRSVAKILGCSPTTLYSWIRRRRISGR